MQGSRGDKENRLVHTGAGVEVKKRGWDEWREQHVKQIAIGNLLFNSENSNWGSVTTQAGQEAEGKLKKDGTNVYL